MPEFTKDGFQGFWQPGRRVDGSSGLVVVVKRRYDIDVELGQCVPSEATPPVAAIAEYDDPEAPERSGLAVAGEAALEKASPEVLVHAAAHAPGGKPKASFEVALRVGQVERRLQILGPRTASWVAPKKRVGWEDKAKGKEQDWPVPVFSKPKPIAMLPLDYRYSYGGYGLLVLDEETQEHAAEHQAEAEKAEAKRKRKAEIEAELEAEAAAEKEAADADAAAVGSEALAPDVAAAFAEGEGATPGGSGTQALDVAAMGLLDEPEDADLAVASPFHFADKAREEPEEGDEATGEALEPPAPEGGTAVLDVEAMGLEASEARDELAAVLAGHDAARRKAKLDDEGTHQDRRRRTGDVRTWSSDWVAAYREQQEAQPDPEPTDLDDGRPRVPYPANPAGLGYCVSYEQDAIEGLPLPQIELPGAPLTPEALVQDLATLDLKTLPPSAGWAPYPQGWFPRAAGAGVYPWDVEQAEASLQQALDGYDPEDPDDEAAIAAIQGTEIPLIQRSFFQESNPVWRLVRLDGDEQVHLTNLLPVEQAPAGKVFFDLPGQHPQVHFDHGPGPQPVSVRLDTLVLRLSDPQNLAVDLLWRGWFPLKDLDAIEGFTKLEFTIGTVAQEAFMEQQALMEADAPKPSEGTKVLAAMPDDDEQDSEVPVLQGAEAERAYREALQARVAAERPDVGLVRDGEGTVVFELSHAQPLSDDAWDDALRAGEDLETVRAREAARRAAAKAAIRKQARERVAAEFPDEDEA